jgi:nucleotide-binding universal stress UspA family protein
MFSKILVASDGSGPAINAAKAAAKMARAMSASLTVVTVSYVPRVYAGDISEAMREGYVDEWKHILEITVHAIERLEVEPEAKLLRGDEPAPAIIKELEAGGYDLLVVGRTGAGGHGMKRTGLTLMGGVSMKLISNAECAVLLVH